MKRIISSVLVVLTIFSAFAFTSCEDNESVTTAQQNQGGTEDTVAPEYTPDLADTNWGDKEFVMLTSSGFWGEQFDREETSDDIVTSAIYNRNRAVETKYGVKIIEKRVSNPEVTIQDAFKSGENSYHCVAMPASYCAPIATDNIFRDLTDVENLDLDKYYWDQTAKDSLTIDNKIFYVTGDLCLSANQATFLMLYNKNLAAKYGIEDDFVQMVKDKKWTIDYLNQVISTYGYNDTDADSAVSVGDTFGLAMQQECYLAFYFGCNGTIIKKDDTDMPSIWLRTKNNISIIDKIYNLTRVDNKAIDTHDWLNVTGTATQDFASVQAFINGRALFFSSNASNMEVFRDMEDDFVVLPLPLMSESQKNYCSYVYNGANVIAIPVLNDKDLAFTGFVLEALAAESYKTVTPAYYEKTLKGKYQRDDRSYDMLDVVFRNRIWDLGYIAKLGGIGDALTSNIKEGANFSSFYARNERQIVKAINDYVEAYENSDK